LKLSFLVEKGIKRKRNISIFISNNFRNSKYKLESEIRACGEKIGGFFDVESCFVLKYADNDLEKIKLYEWSQNQDENRYKTFSDVDNSKLQSLKENLNANSFIEVSNVNKDSENNFIKDLLGKDDNTVFAAVRLLNENN